MKPAQPLDVWISQGSQSPAWQRQSWQAGPWTLAGAVRPGQGMVRIYIEGDGRSFGGSGLPSPDPTPLNPVALKLAMADASGRPAIYLARPCQWEKTAVCNNVKLWTSERYSQNVAEAYADLVTHLSAGQPVEVWGYSGGGWVAVQVAARVPNVVRVVTVAGNVLPNTFNKLHRVPEMVVEDYPDLQRLAALPQTHYVGRRDNIVPPKLARQWAEMLGNPPQVHVVEVDATHAEGWEAALTPLLTEGE